MNCGYMNEYGHCEGRWLKELNVNVDGFVLRTTTCKIHEHIATRLLRRAVRGVADMTTAELMREVNRRDKETT